ncbi:MAG: S24 family peptidase, partial [Clostridia bacterium]|nr:S24 family peptidase [Clostridia bacterium]
VIDHRMCPVVGGKIEGGHPDKVTFFRVPDDSLSGFRIWAGDLLLVVPQAVPVDDAIMIVRRGEMRVARKVKKMPGAMVLLQSYDREFKAETVPLKELVFVGQCIRLERTL